MFLSSLHAFYTKHQTYVLLGLVWLFTLSAMVGISLGYTDWFLSKTPMNMLILCGVLFVLYPVASPKYVAYSLLVFVVSILVEMHGVHYGILFGPYHYLHFLGPKIYGVPWIIGVNWTILVLSTGALATQYLSAVPLRILVGAIAMVLMDAIIEPLAPQFNFWVFEAGMPNWVNYAGWFGTALFFHAVYQFLNLKGQVRASAHILLAQAVFFIYFNLFYGV
jgi:putative membrane protein